MCSFSLGIMVEMNAAGCRLDKAPEHSTTATLQGHTHRDAQKEEDEDVSVVLTVITVRETR